ncbi:MAG: 16S rRNA (guanine(527)-N(7))-methyltransferase RsmG [Betaproteobacteria bacterium]
MISFRARLLERLGAAGLSVRDPVLDRLDQYLALLAHWNRRINLTALPMNPPTDATIDRLIVEPVRAAELVSEIALDWFDLGSGGGSPAIPLKLMRPNARLTMIESRSRKASFLREVVRVLDLPSADVFEGRLEDASALTEKHGLAHLVTCRGIKVDAQRLEAIAALMAGDGRLLLMGTDGILNDAKGFELERTAPFLVLRRN